ncbi:MAG TPA: alpha/beta hydrolase family protein [Pirellulales bacterium]|nr:alpha/beta hydrolase family protein [Pirellulales bacterium]
MATDWRIFLACVLGLAGRLAVAADSDAGVRKGQVEFRPAASERDLPERFQLPASRFTYEQRREETVSQAFRIWTVTFPSPVVTPQANNNTVHCEYFEPTSAGKHPGVVVLHILGGDFPLARLFARSLAQHGAAALFIKMPYYGPRRQPDSPARMVSLDPEETIRGMTQAVLDIRRGAAWLAAQDDVDPEQLGIMGVSLGGITSALAAGAEPRLRNVCLILAGGDIGQVAWEARELEKLRKSWLAKGESKESLNKLLSQIDPVTYAGNVRGRHILMLNARQDEVIPPACTESLWRALGEPEIVWWDAGHYSAVRYLFDGLGKATHFFCASATQSP